MKIEGAKVGKYTAFNTFNKTMFVKDQNMCISINDSNNISIYSCIIFANHLHHRNFKKEFY